MTSHPQALLDEALAEISQLMGQRRRAFCSHAPQREVSLQQLHMLMSLLEAGQMNVSELANMFCVSPPSASSILDRMEERDLVRRVRDEEDRRVVHVEISRHGRDVVEEFIGMNREHIQHLLQSMSPDELHDVIKGVRALQSALSRQQAEKDKALVAL